MRDKRKRVPLPVGPSTWDLVARPRRGARFARKTVSTPRGPALTQVGRAPSLMLEAPTVSSPLEKLCFGARHAQLASSVLRLPQDWERAKLGGVTSVPWPGAK